MQLGKVIGTLWATRKDPKLTGLKFLIVRHLDFDYSEKSGFSVAVDSVGAGVGEVVLCASGSSARLTQATEGRPVDTVIMAIVDRVDLNSGGDAR
ncbi:MAG: EutN/CcmL family microcompartment protein [Calditrichaeota bacterium]|nr:EutN/CcmL family microcompartment protein [Candidatus Cloacimonadota bacterium]MCA9785683.1 EutN/CcmL family microcompartment protein [Candidatus Cloacimonadota bacterium]MCB1045760.1 EutN/CcmL family microcompartment protein [Calditrichota bacterium]MCB9472244.1 EutN/CcmL family microcompartment protein [Candidatus Delongbacteria bacterium]